MTEKRFMVDDAGTLIDMQTRNTYDYVSDVCPLLNELNDENEQLKNKIERIDFILDDLNGAEYISRDDGIKALNKIDKVIGKR